MLLVREVSARPLSDHTEAIAAAIRDANLAVSMVTGDFFVPQNDENGPRGLRAITPYLALASTVGADLIRICMKTQDDIEHARRASDEARERGIRLAHQSHFGSLFETVEGSRDVLRAVDRENFGIIYEAANWMICREDYLSAIRELAPWIFNVYVQNHRVRGESETGDDFVETWKYGPVQVDHIGIWDEGGVDAPRVFEELRAINYDGYVTVHQAFEGVMSPVDAARKSFE